MKFEQNKTAFDVAIASLIFIAVLSYGFYAYSGQDNCIQYTKQFLANKPNRLKTALELLPLVKSESAKYNIDPIIPTVLISLESAWDSRSVGGIGELGLMQVVPNGVCAKGFDLSTPQGQLQAGVHCLKLSRDMCGDDLNEILTCYASGRCISKSKLTQRKIKFRVKLIKKWSTNEKR